ncbi:MAG: VWA domain-containing protein [Acutalibacteraceae bacterium]
MKILKRFVSILLCLALLFGISVIGYSFDEEKDRNANYTVLLLDTCGEFKLLYNGEIVYYNPSSIEMIKTAAQSFAEQILSDSNRNNYIAIVGFGHSASLISGFSNDLTEVTDAISKIEATEYGSDFNGAFKMAETMIDSANGKGYKNIVLFVPETISYGEHKKAGHYSESDCNWRNLDTNIPYYEYANVVYDTITLLKEKYNIFSIGLFSMLSDVPEVAHPYVSFAKRVAEDIQNAGYFEANEPTEVAERFKNVAEFITEEQQSEVQPEEQQAGFFGYIRNFIKRVWEFIKNIFI